MSRTPLARGRLTGPLSRSCPRACSIGIPGKYTAEQVDLIHGWFEAGEQYVEILRRITEFPGNPYCDVKSLRNHHDRHLMEKREPGAILKKVNSVDVLEQVVSSGFANSSRWKPTLADTMRAIQLLHTVKGGAGNSAYDELEAAIAAAVTGDESGMDEFEDEGETVENPAALGLDDEGDSDGDI